MSQSDFNPFYANGLLPNYHQLQYYNQCNQPNPVELQMYMMSLQLQQHEQSVLEYVDYCFKCKNYPQLFRTIETQNFSKENHKYLQKLWYHCHYEEVQSRSKNPLTPVARYRIRKKFPFPTTIWDGEEINYSLKEKSRKYLQEAFNRNIFPSALEKKQFSKETGLSRSQINNWFKNRRQRQRLLLGDKDVKVEEGGEDTMSPMQILTESSTPPIGMNVSQNSEQDDVFSSHVFDDKNSVSMSNCYNTSLLPPPYYPTNIYHQPIAMMPQYFPNNNSWNSNYFTNKYQL